MDEARPDWPAGFGSLSEEEAAELGGSIEEGRAGLGRELAERQEQTLERVTDEESRDDAPRLHVPRR